MNEPLSLPFDKWPEFDRTMWLVCMTQSDDWLECAPNMRWSRRTREAARLSYGRWLRWLLSLNRLDHTAVPAFRATPELMTSFVNDELRRIKAGSVSTALFHLIVLFKSAAPEKDWTWLNTIRTHIKRRAQREPRALPCIVGAQSLYELGLSLMHSAVAHRSEGVIDSGAYLDGLLIAVLIAEFQRINAFAAFKLGQHIRRGPSRWCVHVESEMTKTQQAENGLLPASLTEFIDFYVDYLRPRLLTVSNQGTSSKFWIGTNGEPLSAFQVRKAIKLRTKEAFGLAICPHSFRHSALTSFILDRPEPALYGPALLGHRSKETTERHYFVAQQRLALKTYHDLLDGNTAEDGTDYRAKMLILSASPS